MSGSPKKAVVIPIKNASNFPRERNGHKGVRVALPDAARAHVRARKSLTWDIKRAGRVFGSALFVMGFAALALVGCASVAPAAAVRSPSPHSWSVSCVASAHRVSLDLSPNPLDLSDGADEALRVTARAGSSPPEVVPLSATLYVPLPPVIDSVCKETVGVTAGEDRLLVLLALDGRPNLDYLLSAVLLEASTSRSIAVRQLIAEILEPMEVSIVKNGVRLTAICRDNPDNRNDGPSGVLFDSLTIAAVGDEIHVEWPAASKCDRARRE